MRKKEPNIEKMKTFQVYRCHKNPKGQYLITAPSAKYAANAIGCSPYHLKNYSHAHIHGEAICFENPDIKMSRENPGVVYKRNKYNEPYSEIPSKNSSLQSELEPIT